MAWLDETEPYELKPHITRKRIMRGLTPERRKWKDASQLRKQIRLYLSWAGRETFMGIDSNGIPFWIDENGVKVHRVAGWNRDFVDGKYPHYNGKLQEDATGRIAKSSRRYMYMVASWWQEATAAPAIPASENESEVADGRE